MSLMEELSALGVDTAEGLERVMGDNDLYVMMLGMFTDAIQSSNITPADFDGGSLEDLTNKVHTLKGTTGNLALTPLFNAYNEALGLLRAGQPAQAKAVYERMLPVQLKILDCISRHNGA